MCERTVEEVRGFDRNMKVKDIVKATEATLKENENNHTTLEGTKLARELNIQKFYPPGIPQVNPRGGGDLQF